MSNELIRIYMFLLGEYKKGNKKLDLKSIRKGTNLNSIVVWSRLKWLWKINVVEADATIVSLTPNGFKNPASVRKTILDQLEIDALDKKA
jgi:hypothetical protein